MTLYTKGRKAGEETPGVVFVREDLHRWCESVFFSSDVLIFIGASGIAVRTVAPFLVSKMRDPAVLVADELGKHIISLLSGHLGGGNELTVYLADRLGADPVITTSSDVHGKMALDVWAKQNNLYLTDLNQAKRMAARIVRGEIVPFFCEGSVSGQIPPELRRIDELAGKGNDEGVLIVSPRVFFDPPEKRHTSESLHLVPRVVTLGMGCRKDTPFYGIRDFVYRTLRELKISPKSIEKLVSVDRKEKEEGLRKMADVLGVPFEVFPAKQLEGVPGSYSSSAFVRDITGVDNICERAAMASLSARERKNARFLCRKTVGDGVTMALLVRKWGVSFA